jgi:hypothetical protein
MAHKAKLEIDGNTYRVLECDYEITQATKDNGQPSAVPKGGMINLTLVSLDDKDMLFHEWAIEKLEQKDGEIFFEVVNEGKPSHKALFFKDAYCVKLKEVFSDTDTKQMHMMITISAAEISFGGGAMGLKEALTSAVFGSSPERATFKRWANDDGNNLN